LLKNLKIKKNTVANQRRLQKARLTASDQQFSVWEQFSFLAHPWVLKGLFLRSKNDMSSAIKAQKSVQRHQNENCWLRTQIPPWKG